MIHENGRPAGLLRKMRAASRTAALGLSVLTLVFGLSLAGCGGDDGGEDDTKKDTTTTDPNKVATPVANPAAGAVQSGTEITLTCDTASAKIYYTLDGNTPTTSSTLYYGGGKPKITAANKTLKAIAVLDGKTDSDVLTAEYTIAPPEVKWVAVGEGGKLATSKDGATWTAADVSNTNFSTTTDIERIFYAGGKWFAFATGKSAKSDNGTDWEQIGNYLPLNYSSKGIAADSSKWIIISSNSALTLPLAAASSSSWTTVNGAGSLAIAYDGAAGTKRWLSAGYYNNALAISYSSTGNDGEFTQVNTNLAFKPGRLAYGNNTWVVIEDQYTDGGGIARSTDNGVNWNAVTLSGFKNIYAIAYGGASGQEKFVVVGETATSAPRIMTSTDGTTWNEATITNSGFDSTYGSILGVAYGDSKWIAVGKTSWQTGGTGVSAIATSTDGTTWTAVSQTVFGSGFIRDVAYVGE